MSRVLIRFLVCVLILGAAAVGAFAMIRSRPAASRDAAPPVPPVVEVLRALPVDTVARVTGTGEVVPAREVTIVPEISGRVIEQASRLVPGGRFDAGEILLRVDPRNFENEVRQRRNQLEQARLDLEVEVGRAAVARKEWRLHGDASAAAKPLALREPYLAAARSHVEAAESALERAEIDLSRTVIRAPFDGTVTRERVEVGQYVSPQSSIATVVGTDRFWVQVSIPVDRLRYLSVPRAGVGEGSPARVTQELRDGSRVVRSGFVAGLISELEAETRTAQLLVSIADPLDPPAGHLPLLPGAFVSVEISGETLPGLIEVPRKALIGGEEVWVVAGDETLVRRSLEIAWSDRRSVYAASGIVPGELVVVSRLALPVEGMSVRPHLAEADHD